MHVARRLVRNMSHASFYIPSVTAYNLMLRCSHYQVSVCRACSRDFYAKRAARPTNGSRRPRRVTFSSRFLSSGYEDSRATAFRRGRFVRRIYRRHGPHVSLINKAYGRDVTRIRCVCYYRRTDEHHCVVSPAVLRSNRLII